MAVRPREDKTKDVTKEVNSKIDKKANKLIKMYGKTKHATKAINRDNVKRMMIMMTKL